MTIGIGTIDANTITIGTDSLWTWDEHFVRDHKTSKFINLPSDYSERILIASSGQDKFTQIFEKLIWSDPKCLNLTNKHDVNNLVDALQVEVARIGVGDPDSNELPEHNLGFLIGSTITKRLWVIESDYNVIEFDDYVCIGSGAFLGESAMKALSKVDVRGKLAIETSLKTVMELHPYCGGRIEIRQITF